MERTMQRLQPCNRRPILLSSAGRWGAADIVGTGHGVTLSLTGENYDVTGWLRSSSALANLSLDDARRLSGLLNEAIAFCEDTADQRQDALPAVWSPSSFTQPIKPPVRAIHRRRAE
jgi:hypothetical protein